ncbi:hypothetical protein [Seleniivibrio woodruffii]|uniref:hypothetical protein n=1 Tax=Seleniivibrio woodruffii TaxID=1078050 RepID=UPI00240A67B2|nr:hypothetical protein [Seleniivibrio woodruffii]
MYRRPKNISRFSYRILPEKGLIVLNFHSLPEDLGELIQQANDAIVNSPDYREGMNLLVNYKAAIFPDFQIFFNDIDRELNLTVRVNRLVGIICAKDTELAENLRVFHLFKRRNTEYTKRVDHVSSLRDALNLLGMDEDADYIGDVLADLSAEDR